MKTVAPNSRKGVRRKPLTRGQILLIKSLTLISAYVFIPLLRDELLGLPIATLGNVGTVFVLLAVLLVSHVTENGMWSVPSIYLIVFGVFHFGLTSTLGLGMLSDQVIDEDQICYWLFRSSTKEALYLACLGLLACAIGIHLGLLFFSRLISPVYPSSTTSQDESRISEGLFDFGRVILTLAVGTWFVVVLLVGGPSLLISSYVTYLELTAPFGVLFGFAWLGVGIGLSFLAASGSSRRSRAAFVSFSAFTVFGFPLGLRGEILFSVLPALAILWKRRRPPSTRATVIIGMALLVAISTAKNLRQIGLGGIGESGVSGNILDGLAEMGSSLRPVSEVVSWHDAGEDFIYGGSYWAPIDRTLAYIIPGWPRPPAENDPRIMNILVQQRVGPIGFSPIAEAYRNFGEAGVSAVMFTIGLVLGRMESWRNTPINLALIGVILVELLINVRNDFVSVISHITFGVMLVYSVVLLKGFRRVIRGVPTR